MNRNILSLKKLQLCRDTSRLSQNIQSRATVMQVVLHFQAKTSKTKITDQYFPSKFLDQKLRATRKVGLC